MLQAVLKELGRIELEEVTPRKLKPGEVRLKVISCAICGSDIRIYNYGNSRVKLPHVTGHEVVGKIIEVADADCPLRIGDYCCFGADLPCGDSNCKYCNRCDFGSCDKNLAIGYQFDGGFAEEMIIPKMCYSYGATFGVIPVVDDSVYKYSLVEPLACAIHGVEPLNVTNEDDVLIFGGGPIGLMIGDICQNVNLCKSVTIVELSETRIELIKKLFPSFIVVNNFSCLDKDYDVIFTANSVPICHKQAIEIAAKNARINLFGGLGTSDLVAVDTNKIHYKQLLVTGTHGSNKSHFDKAFKYIESGAIQIEKYITAMYSLKDINIAFDSAKNFNNLKIIIKPE
jgi:L-iditol 2-dehydrogenase